MVTAVVTETEQRVSIPDFSLEGKTALVTGGSRGIGKAIALALASRGADVGLTCFTGCKFAEDVRTQIGDLGRRAEYFAHDVGDVGEVSKLAGEVGDGGGGVLLDETIPGLVDGGGADEARHGQDAAQEQCHTPGGPGHARCRSARKAFDTFVHEVSRVRSAAAQPGRRRAWVVHRRRTLSRIRAACVTRVRK